MKKEWKSETKPGKKKEKGSIWKKIRKKKSAHVRCSCTLCLLDPSDD